MFEQRLHTRINVYLQDDFMSEPDSSVVRSFDVEFDALSSHSILFLLPALDAVLDVIVAQESSSICSSTTCINYYLLDYCDHHWLRINLKLCRKKKSEGNRPEERRTVLRRKVLWSWTSHGKRISRWSNKRKRERQEKEIEDEGERMNSWTVCIEKEGDRKAQNALSQCSQVD